ncbi:MAG TPA: hypothetical protein VHZ97_09955 [Pseudonocardiaceae bacterium]|jgi:hypothetical protein|nr:hypothetical protein [Pseudonocardiaceae bacterium]
MVLADNPTTTEWLPTKTKDVHCAWCGRPLPVDAKDGRSAGRRRRYCAQPCRQRAYERRSAVVRGGLPEDAVVLSATEIADLQDRLFQLRCAAEDVVTAVDDGAAVAELRGLAAGLVDTARGLERLR